MVKEQTYLLILHQINIYQSTFSDFIKSILVRSVHFIFFVHSTSNMQMSQITNIIHCYFLNFLQNFNRFILNPFNPMTSLGISKATIPPRTTDMMMTPIKPNVLADGRGSSAEVFLRMLDDSVDFSTSISFFSSAIFALSSSVEFIVTVFDTGTQFVGQAQPWDGVVVPVVDGDVVVEVECDDVDGDVVVDVDCDKVDGDVIVDVECDGVDEDVVVDVDCDERDENVVVDWDCDEVGGDVVDVDCDEVDGNVVVDSVVDEYSVVV